MGETIADGIVPAPKADRPISGPDVFRAVAATIGINVGVSIIIGMVMAMYIVTSKVAGNPAEAIQTDFNFIVGLTTVMDGLILVALLLIARRFAKKPLAYFFPSVPLKTLTQAALSALIFMVLCVAVDQGVKYGFHIEMNVAKYETAMMPKSWQQFAIVIGCFALFVPLYEEVFFRGYLFGWMKQVMPVWLAMAISAALFAGVHGLFVLRGGVSGWVVTGELFVMGLLLAWWVKRSNSLWPALTIHVVNNAVAFTFAFFLKDYL